jgi:hypothetical protein
MYLRPDNPDCGLMFLTPAPNTGAHEAFINLAGSPSGPRHSAVGEYTVVKISA